MGAFSWQNATYTIQFILMIYINSEKLMLPEDALLLNFSVESAENWEKKQKVATQLLFDHSEQALPTYRPSSKIRLKSETRPIFFFSP